MHVTTWAAENGCEMNQSYCRMAATTGDLDVLRFFRERGDCPRISSATFRIAARAGHLPVLQYIWAQQDFLIDREDAARSACAHASFAGHLDVLTWMEEQVRVGEAGRVPDG